MTHHIQSGDRALVLRGFTQGKSPNVGLTVTVGHTVLGNLGMPHTRFGRVVRISGPGLKQMNDAGEFVETGWADIPVAWLQKIDPQTPKTTTSTKELENA